ncbi:helix-turn-helix transcriptional regulator [Stappia albiluteola]|nr:WYL domain-containing protein [Stappia albiluteola]
MDRRDTASRLARLDLLASRLKAEEPMSVAGLAEEFGVSRRTLFRDIALLRERGLPIEADRGRGGGIRLERNWGIGRLKLSYREAVELLISLAIAEQMEAPWIIANLAPIRRKLAASFSQTLRERVDSLTRRIKIGPSASPAVLQGFVQPDSKTGEALCRAFLELRLLRFSYTDGEGSRSRRQVEPHYLLLSYPVWYLVAWDHERKAVRSFRLDRMHNGDILSEEFKLRPFEYFAEVFAGVPAVSP